MLQGRCGRDHHALILVHVVTGRHRRPPEERKHDRQEQQELGRRASRSDRGGRPQFQRRRQSVAGRRGVRRPGQVHGRREELGDDEEEDGPRRVQQGHRQVDRLRNQAAETRQAAVFPGAPECLITKEVCPQNGGNDELDPDQDQGEGETPPPSRTDEVHEGFRRHASQPWRAVFVYTFASEPPNKDSQWIGLSKHARILLLGRGFARRTTAGIMPLLCGHQTAPVPPPPWTSPTRRAPKGA